MNQRKLCQSCNKPLMSFQGYYLHPEVPCAGVQDSIQIEAEIEDELLHKKFIEIYDKPIYSDYERIALLEEENNRMSKQLLLLQEKIIGMENQLKKSLIKFLLKFL